MTDEERAAELGRAIKCARTLLGAKQIELAEALKVDQSVVSRMESGHPRYIEHQDKALAVLYAIFMSQKDEHAIRVLDAWSDV